MLLEQLVNITIQYYLQSRVAFFAKQELGIKFKTVTNAGLAHLHDARIAAKSTVDYYGLYQGRYISFEAKSTELAHLPLGNIRPHQHAHLLLVHELGGWAFYLVFFKKFGRFFLLEAHQLPATGQKTISLGEMEQLAIEIKLVFPGIIDFLAYYPACSTR